MSSTLCTLMPQRSVASSRILVMLVLMKSREVSVASRSISPTMLRRVVAVRFSIAEIGLSTPYVNCMALVIWKNTTVSICIVTLSFVITDWGLKSTTCSLMETFFAILSMKGTLTWRPVVQAAWNAPKRSTT